MKNKITKTEALEKLNKGSPEAEKILKNEDKFEKFLHDLENKLKSIPKYGDKLSYIPIFASLVKSYFKKEYTKIPTGSIIFIISALGYFISHFDIIPDWIPFVGYLDDFSVVAACVEYIKQDIDEYIVWREQNGKNS